MYRSLSKYDYTAFSIPQSSEEIHPRYTKLVRDPSSAILSAENIFTVQLKCIIAKYPETGMPVPLKDCLSWQFIDNQIRSLDREFEIIPCLDDSRIRSLMDHLHRVFRSVDPGRRIPVARVRQDATPWSAARQTNRLYYFNWELHDKSIPMLLDFFHAVVQFNVMYYQCNDIGQVQKSIRQVLSGKEFQRIVGKFAIDVDLHFKVYLLFATSYYLRIYIENYFPRDIIHRFMTIWHEGLISVE